MNLGTKSLLFGNHQFILHPLFVTWGWKKYHKQWPTWKEFICIVIHDWGYWGCKNMDGKDGKEHPVWAARWARKYIPCTTLKYWSLCLFHSNHFVKYCRVAESPLHWPDKLGSVLQPWWLWVGLGRLTGEIYEYTNDMNNQENLGYPNTHKEYFMAYRNYVLKQVVYDGEHVEE